MAMDNNGEARPQARLEDGKWVRPRADVHGIGFPKTKSGVPSDKTNVTITHTHT